MPRNRVLPTDPRNIRQRNRDRMRSTRRLAATPPRPVVAEQAVTPTERVAHPHPVSQQQTPSTSGRRRLPRRSALSTPRRALRISSARMSHPAVLQTVRPSRSGLASARLLFESAILLTPDPSVQGKSNSEVPNVKYRNQIKLFHKHMSAITKGDTCKICNECFPMMQVKNSTCNRCENDPFTFSADNGLDPGNDVPGCLTCLTRIEQKLIARISPVMSIYRLGAGGQYAYSGHVINFPQDCQQIAKHLPRTVDEIDVLVVRYSAEEFHKDFQVSRSRVRAALEYLRANNPMYSDIVIDEQRLLTLPECGQMALNALGLEDEADTVTDRVETGPLIDDVDELPPLSDPSTTFYPSNVTAAPRTEDTQITAAVDALLESEDEDVPMESDSPIATNVRSGPVIVDWPAIDYTAPVNEYNTAGYFTMAWPWLFPDGRGDFHSPAVREKQKLTLHKYFKHLLRHKSGRFARDVPFRYFGLNTYLRQQAISTSSYFMRNSEDLKNLTVEDIRGMTAAEKKAFIKRVVRYGSSLPGTKPYWSARRQELIAMVDQLGMPTFFVTLSAADLQWPELSLLLPDSDRRTAVNNNPLLVDWFFMHRINTLFKTLFPAMGVVDHWGRYEYQHRGSIHYHGVLFMKDAPDVEQEVKTAEGQQKVVDYFDQYISAVNPSMLNGEPCRVRPPVNPASVDYHSVTEDKELDDYTDLLVCCQRHTKHSKYCLRKKQPNGRLGAPNPNVFNPGGDHVCRFRFDKPLAENSHLVLVVDEKTGGQFWEFIPARNDPKINLHCRDVTVLFRSNTDFTPILDPQKVLSYILKYSTKAEQSSEHFQDIMRAVCSDAASNVVSAKTVASKLLMSTLVQRDIGAQEASHILAGFPLYKCSRTFSSINLLANWNGLELGPRCRDELVKKNQIDKYLDAKAGKYRPALPEDVCLYDFVAGYYIREKTKLVKRKAGHESIVIIKPNLRFCEPNDPNYEQYCYNYCLLYRPFEGSEQSFKDNAVQLYEEIAAGSGGLRGKFGDLFTQTLSAQRNDNPATDEAELEQLGDATEQPIVDDWMVTYLKQSSRTFGPLTVNDSSFNWGASADRYTDDQWETISTFMSAQRNTFQPAVPLNTADPAMLNPEQRRLYDAVVNSQAGPWNSQPGTSGT